MSQKQQDILHSEKRKPRSRRRRILFTIMIVLIMLLLIGVAQILGGVGLLPGYWASISSSVTGVLGLILTFLQLLPIFFPADEKSLPIHIHIPDNLIHQTSTSTNPLVLEYSRQEASSSVIPISQKEFRGILGVLPPTSSLTIQQRIGTVHDIYNLITGSDTNAVVLTGIGGIGKSTLAALVYRYIEKEKANERSFFKAPSAWLTVDPGVTMADLVGTIFELLEQPMPDLNHLTPSNQASLLFQVLSVTDKPRLIVLDQFENFLDWQTGQVFEDRPGIGEWIDALNNQEVGSPGCRILLTSRIYPKGTREYPITHAQEYIVKGLDSAEGIELLKKQAKGARATEADMRLAVEKCAGHAYALTLLASLMKKHNVKLSDLFSNPLYEELWEGDIARKMLDYIYRNQLRPIHRDLLLAFSVYRQAVPIDAAQTVMNSETRITIHDLLNAISVLHNQHLIQTTHEGSYQLHAIVKGYAHRHFDETDEQRNMRLLHDAYKQAAHYYLQLAAISSPPRGKRRTISDMQPFIEAGWELCKANLWQEAYKLIEEDLFLDLIHLGGLSVLLELYTELFPLDKWNPTQQEKAAIYKHMGLVHARLGNREQGRDYYREALALYQAISDRDGQIDTLIYLGEAYHALGPLTTALEYYQQALDICKNTGGKAEALLLHNLCSVYSSLGQSEQSLIYGQRSLIIYQALNDRWGVGKALGELAELHFISGNHTLALQCREQSLQLYRELGNRWEEGWALFHLGRVYYQLEKIAQAQNQYEQALTIGKLVGNRWVENAALNAQGDLLGNLGQKEHALGYVQRALLVSRTVKDRWGESRALTTIGKLYSDMKQGSEALRHFAQSLMIVREIGNTLEEYTLLFNVSRVYIQLQDYNTALASLLLAEAIANQLQNQYTIIEVEKSFEEMRALFGEEEFSLSLESIKPLAKNLLEDRLQADARI